MQSVFSRATARSRVSQPSKIFPLMPHSRIFLPQMKSARSIAGNPCCRQIESLKR
jgi:hypothetical protein